MQTTKSSGSTLKRGLAVGLAVVLAWTGLAVQPAAAATAASYSGVGTGQSERFALDPGIYVLGFSYSGGSASEFVARVRNEEGVGIAFAAERGVSGSTKQFTVSSGEELWLDVEAAAQVEWKATLVKATLPATVKKSIAVNGTGSNGAKLYLLEKGVYTYRFVNQGSHVPWIRIGVASPGGESPHYLLARKVPSKNSLSGTFTLAERSLVWVDPMVAWPGESWTVTVDESQPTISGTAAVGKKLTARTGTPGWAPADARFGYQWRRDGKKIKGATKATYTPKAADKGKKISVTVTASKAGTPKISRTSAETKAVKAGSLTSATPKITGKAKVGKKLKAKPGTWKPSGVKFSYRWLRDGQPIKGATKSTYKLKKADKGKRISVTVKGSKAGYTSVTLTSKATAKI